MSNSDSPKYTYQLIFEGPEREDDAALRRLRATLVSELALGVDRAKMVLDMAPISVEESENESDLLPHLRSLTNAGARALIVRHMRVKKGQQAAAKNQEVAELAPASADEPIIDHGLTELDAQFDNFLEGLEENALIDSRKRRKQLRLVDHFVLEDKKLTHSSQIKKKSSTQTRTEEPMEIGWWSQYRRWITKHDKAFRKRMNEEVLFTLLVVTLLSVTACALLVPFELYARAAKHQQNRNVADLIDKYVDVAVYGESTKRRLNYD